MTLITTEQIAELREKLADYPEALKSLDAIEDCEGDVEDAAMNLAIKIGQQPDMSNSEWLASLAKKCRAVICQQEYRNNLINGDFTCIWQTLSSTKLCPKLLILPVLICVVEQGINKFCEPLDRIYN
jgi:hypothetical protein